MLLEVTMRYVVTFQSFVQEARHRRNQMSMAGWFDFHHLLITINMAGLCICDHHPKEGNKEKGEPIIQRQLKLDNPILAKYLASGECGSCG